MGFSEFLADFTFLNNSNNLNCVEFLANCMETVKNDVTTYDILKDYYKDEEHDLYDDENELALIKKLGEANWLMTKL
ncbi:MAG: hypothetical protein NC343_08535 [Muribaculum sp.]|nr:hypothetical protein [Muribaculaceae bacterium]MCM1081782.1 hypothetical protein [Muribaculum sp.]